MNAAPRIKHAIGCLVGLAAMPAAAGVVPCDPVGDPLVFGDAIVRVAAGSTIETVIAELEARPELAGVTFSVADGSLAGRRIYLLAYDPPAAADAVESVIHPAKGEPPVPIEWGETLYENHDPEGETGSVWFHTVEGSVQFFDQYAQTMLGLPAAQVRSTGAGAVVAVLDTGIDDTHPLLAGVVAPGGFNFVTGTTDTGDTGDGADNDGDGLTDESTGHGTFVAGLVHLVAPDALLLPVVVLDSDGGGQAWTLVRGMYHAIDQSASVMNLSLGSTYDSLAVQAAMAEAKSLGIAVVAAGGNCGAGEEREEFPAADSGSIGVAAVDDLDVKAAFSNYNPKFSLSAPGTSAPLAGTPDGFDPERTIYSALSGGDYGIWEGTSFATAFVSGTAALLRSAHPEWPAGAAVGRVRLLLKTAAADIYSIPANLPYAADQSLGAGRLDTAAALALGAGDLDLDGAVGTTDFLMLLAAWGPCPGEGVCLADLDADGAVGVLDFLALLAGWG